MMKKTIVHAVAIALLVGFAVLGLGSMGSSPSSYSSSSSGGGGGSSYTYICTFVNNSRYDVTVSVGDTTGIVPSGESRYIEVDTWVTSFTYTPSNFVTYTGDLNGTVTFRNR